MFTKYHCPPEYQIALYGQVREKLVRSWEGRDTKWQKFISDGAHYIRKSLGGDPNIDALDMDDAINSAAESIGKIQKPTDFLEAVLVSGKNNDSKIENDFVYSKFVDSFVPDDSILVINPSPDFLCQYPAEFLEKTTFCVPYQPMVWVLEHVCEYIEKTDYQFSDMDIATIIYHSELSETEKLRLLSELGQKTEDTALCQQIEERIALSSCVSPVGKELSISLFS